MLLFIAQLLPVSALPAQVPMELEAHAEGALLVVNALVGEADGEQPAFSAMWRFPASGAAPSCTFDRALNAPPGVALAMDRLLLVALGQYLDAHLTFQRDGVRTDRPVEVLSRDMDGLIASAMQEAGAVEVLGLSPPTRDHLARFCALDWSRAHFGTESGGAGDRYLAIYRFIRSQRDELERQLKVDLLPLATVNVLARPGDPAHELRINSICGTVFDSDNFLCALDLGLGPDTLALDSSTVPAAPSSAQPRRMRKRDRWIKEEFDAIHDRIERMDQRRELWELRDRVEDIEDRISGLELEARERPETGNSLAELGDLSGRPLIIRFERASTQLAPQDILLLGEVLEQLARHPAHRLLITGYADRSGEATANLWYSEQRARVVRDHLVRRGVAADRMLVNFVGDSRSSGPDPEERRVEIEWLH